jgi:hypothetical protein
MGEFCLLTCPISEILKMNQLEPGDLLFSDQHESPLLGRQFSARWTDFTTQKYRGCTIF